MGETAGGGGGGGGGGRGGGRRGGRGHRGRGQRDVGNGQGAGQPHRQHGCALVRHRQVGKAEREPAVGGGGGGGKRLIETRSESRGARTRHQQQTIGAGSGKAIHGGTVRDDRAAADAAPAYPRRDER